MSTKLHIYGSEVMPSLNNQTDVVLRVKFMVSETFPDWPGPNGEPMLVTALDWAVLDTANLGSNFISFEALTEEIVSGWVINSPEYAAAVEKLNAQHDAALSGSPVQKQFLFIS